MRVLPADVYDMLELSALAFGGIGGPDVWEGDGDDAFNCPVCIYGHAAFAVAASSIMDGPIYRALERVDINGGIESDGAVYRVNERKRRPRTSRIPFPEWCAELGVVRGA